MENCKWRLKVNDGEVIEFTNEEDVKTYIAANRNRYNWETDPELLRVTTETYVDGIINKAKKDTFSETAKITPLKNRNLAINEDSLEEGDSDTIAVTDVITKPNKEGKRLAPEVIAENYESDLFKNYILELLQRRGLNINTLIFQSGLTTDQRLDAIKEELFHDTLITEKTAEHYLTSAANKFRIELNSGDAKSLIERVQNTVKENFRIQLMGEFVHNIFYNLIERKLSPYALKERYGSVMAYIAKRFSTMYQDQRTWLQEEAKAFTVSKVDFDEMVDDVNAVYQTILMQHSGSDGKLRGGVKIYSEIDLTANLGYEIDGKSKIRGKLDLFVIDGDVATIYDIKFSKKPYDKWAKEKRLTAIYQQAFYGRVLNQLGINTNSLQYYLVPIYKFKGKLISDGLKNITEEVTAPYVVRNLDEYIPRVLYSEYKDPEEMLNIDKKIAKVLPEEYILAKTYRLNKEIIEKNNIIRYRNGRIDFVNDITGKKEPLSGEDVIPERIDRYIEELKESRPAMINNFIGSLKSILKGTLPDSIPYEGNSRRRGFYKALLDKYYNQQDRYIIVDNQNLFDRGLIPIVDTVNNAIDVLILDELNLDDTLYYSNNGKLSGLFELIAKPGTTNAQWLEQQYLQKQILPLEATRGNAALLKALIVLNERPAFQNLKLGTIRAVNPFRSQSLEFNERQIAFIEDVLSQLAADEEGTLMSPNLTILKDGPYKGQSRFTSIVDKVSDQIMAIFRIDQSEENAIHKIIKSNSDLFISSNFETNNIEDLVDRLETLLESIRKMGQLDVNNLDMSNQTARVYAWVSQIYNYYKNIDLFEEESPAKLFGQGFPNWFDSLMINSLDTIRSNNVVYFRNILATAFQKIRNEYTNWLAELRKEEQKYEDSIGHGIAASNLIGAKGGLHRNLYRTDTFDLTFKDPWDMSNDLSEAERQMLKFALKTITGKSSRAELDTNDFLVPLVRVRLASLVTNGNLSAKTIRDNFAYGFNSFIKDTFSERAKEQESAADAFDQLAFEFEDRKNEDKRVKLIQEYGIGAFETNLEIILASYKMAEVKKRNIDKVLPQIRAMQATLALKGNLTGIDVSNIMEFIADTTKSTLYFESLVPEEMRGMFKSLSALRSVASSVALSWHFANLPREVLMGFWTNLSNAMFRRYGKEAFTIKDYGKALKYLIYDSPKFMTEITKIELLNELYALANMDLRNMVENTISYKNGIIGGFSRYSGWALTAPDYWNRMSIFLAQMIHDGTFDAHYIDKDSDGIERLKYDMEKDRRFDVYLKYKDHAVPDAVKATYEKQYGLYIAMLRQFNVERERTGEPLYKVGDKFEMAYTVLQRESIKSFADESFGYYDLETKAEWNKLWQGMLFKQFMTYLSAKKTQYTLKRTTVASQGHFTPVVDVKGNQKYIKIITDANGTWVNSEIVNENTGIPLYSWEGRVMEGIFQTYQQLFKDVYLNVKQIVNKDPELNTTDLWRKYVRSNGIEAANFKASLYDLTMFLFFAKLLQMALLDDPEETGIKYKDQIADRSWWFRNGIDLVNRSIDDLGVINAITNGALNWNPPFLSILQNSIKSYYSAFKLEDINFAEAALLGTVNTFGMFRPFRQDINNTIKES